MKACAVLTPHDELFLRYYAKHNMKGTATGNALFMHRNTVEYHLIKIKERTGLDPKNFFDLVALLKWMGELE